MEEILLHLLIDCVALSLIIIGYSTAQFLPKSRTADALFKFYVFVVLFLNTLSTVYLL